MQILLIGPFWRVCCAIARPMLVVWGVVLTWHGSVFRGAATARKSCCMIGANSPTKPRLVQRYNMHALAMKTTHASESKLRPEKGTLAPLLRHATRRVSNPRTGVVNTGRDLSTLPPCVASRGFCCAVHTTCFFYIHMYVPHQRA